MVLRAVEDVPASHYGMHSAKIKEKQQDSHTHPQLPESALVVKLGNSNDIIIERRHFVVARCRESPLSLSLSLNGWLVKWITCVYLHIQPEECPGAVFGVSS